jgi:hypothetical protein
MFSMRELEGYVRIDHRESPGFTPEEAARAGLAGLPVGRGQLCEVPVANCVYCHAHVRLNPLRTRDRGYCPKYHGYVCDRCEVKRVLGQDMKPWKQIVDEFIDAAAKGKV